MAPEAHLSQSDVEARLAGHGTYLSPSADRRITLPGGLVEAAQWSVGRDPLILVCELLQPGDLLLHLLKNVEADLEERLQRDNDIGLERLRIIRTEAGRNRIQLTTDLCVHLGLHPEFQAVAGQPWIDGRADGSLRPPLLYVRRVGSAIGISSHSFWTNKHASELSEKNRLVSGTEGA